jgi:hypothetical protein
VQRPPGGVDTLHDKVFQSAFSRGYGGKKGEEMGEEKRTLTCSISKRTSTCTATQLPDLGMTLQNSPSPACSEKRCTWARLHGRRPRGT